MSKKNNKMVKVVFDLGSDTWHGFSTESVWATNLGAGTFRLENSPFFAKGVSFRDTVKAMMVEDEINVVGFNSKSGHSTYRILVLQDEHNSALFTESWEPLERMGCTYEHGDFGWQLYAVDVPNTANIEIVYECLERGEDKNAWSFEEGHCGHQH